MLTLLSALCLSLAASSSLFRTFASPVVSPLGFIERQTDSTSFTDSNTLYTELPQDNDYANFAEMQSSADISDIETSIETTVYSLLPGIFSLLSATGPEMVSTTGSYNEVYTSLFCKRFVSGNDTELKLWFAYMESVDSVRDGYAASMASGFLNQLEIANAIEACAIVLDKNGIVILVFLLAMAWYDQNGYVFKKHEVIDKLDACYNAFQSGS